MQNSSENKRIIGFWYKDFSIAQAGEIYFTKDAQENPILCGAGERYSQIDYAQKMTGSVFPGKTSGLVGSTIYKLCIKADNFANTRVKLYRRSHYSNQSYLLRENFLVSPEDYVKNNANPANIINENGIVIDVHSFDFAEYVMILEKPDASQLQNFSAWLELSSGI